MSKDQMTIIPLGSLLRSTPSKMARNVDYISELILEMQDLTNTRDPILKMIVDIGNQTNIEIPAPFHDYRIGMPRKDAKEIMKCAIHLYENCQSDIVDRTYKKLYSADDSYIEGRMQLGSDTTMAVLKDKYRLVDISLDNKRPMLLSFYRLSLTFRCFDKAFDGKEYAMQVVVLIKSKPSFDYRIHSIGFTHIKETEDPEHELESIVTKDEA